MLTLNIDDAHILDKLAQYTSEIDEQELIALYAMRLGLEAISVMRGEIDKQALQQVGESILGRVHETVVNVLDEHRQTILNQFSMDIPDSAMNKLSNHINQSYANVHNEVISLGQYRKDQRNSPQGGVVFEAEIGNVLKKFALSANDSFEPIGDVIGKKDKRKVGDFLITLGETGHAPGENIVIEAKKDKTYNKSRALSECKMARDNRDAQVCIFVWDKESCGGKHVPLKRYENDIIVLWDASDKNTDIYIEAAFWLARSLITPKTNVNVSAQVHLDLLQNAFDQISQGADELEKIKQSGQQIIDAGNKVLSGCINIRAVLISNIDTMQSQVKALYQTTRTFDL